MSIMSKYIIISQKKIIENIVEEKMLQTDLSDSYTV